MRMLFFFPTIYLSFLSNNFVPRCSEIFQNDTTIISHVLDGNTTEWPEEKFKLANEIKILYATDNDSQNLFIALKISDKAMQSKIIQQGMSLYIDSKGKKKENRGVEFPVKDESNSNLVNRLDHMKLFGFTPIAPFTQSIKTEGTINIAATWDSTNVLNVEYHIPLRLLETSLTELKNRKVSIGFKLNENENNNQEKVVQTETKTYSTTSTIVGVPDGTNPPRTAPNSVVNKPNPAVQQVAANKTQSYWTSHTIIF